MKRDSYWDSLKFVLIFLVVLAHCVSSYRPSGGINQALYNYLCTICMPSFIFVSGMFSQVKDKGKYKIGIHRILETYVVFQIIRAVTPMLISGSITLSSIAHVIIFPSFTLWYLMSLIFWRLMVFFTPEKILRDNPIRIILICFLISLLGGFIPVNHQFSIQRTMTYLPFFFMGYYAKNIDVKKYIGKFPPLLAIGVLFSVFLIIFFVFNRYLDFVILGKKAYWHNPEYSPLMLCFARLMFLVSAIITGTMVMRLVMLKPSFPEWGKLTLFIYIYHSFLIQAFRFAFRHGYLPHQEWVCMVMSVIIMAILLFLSKIKFFHILLNPVSYIHEKKRNCKQ